VKKPPTTQRRELTQACQRHGWDIVQVFEGAVVRGRDARTAFNATCKAVEQRELDIVAAWSVDRRPAAATHHLDDLPRVPNKAVRFGEVEAIDESRGDREGGQGILSKIPRD
jgi:DNA invertase Pin-like site-specific DNA recombinase